MLLIVGGMIILFGEIIVFGLLWEYMIMDLLGLLVFNIFLTKTETEKYYIILLKVNEKIFI